MAWRYLLVLTLIFGLNGCTTNYHPDLTNMPPDDPSDSLLQSAIHSHLQRSNAPLNSQYEYSRVDLNNDGLREGLVLLTLPHHYWCGNGGCTMMVFKADEDEFTPMSTIQNIRPPVVVSPITTKGWSDFVLNLSGQDGYDKTTVLMYDGSSYPSDTAAAPSVPYPVSNIEGKRLFP